MNDPADPERRRPALHTNAVPAGRTISLESIVALAFLWMAGGSLHMHVWPPHFSIMELFLLIPLLFCIAVGAQIRKRRFRVCFGLVQGLLLVEIYSNYLDSFSAAAAAYAAGVIFTLGYTALFVVITDLVIRVRPRARQPGLCSKCDYNLTGNVSGRCPECGEPCTSSTAAGSPQGSEGIEPRK